ncbi:MAG: FkbH like protein [Phycisphaerales bacterium]|nr:FkbH like protein [Phycisphaerales bacterium]
MTTPADATPPSTRDQIEHAIRDGNWALAKAALLRLWESNPAPGAAPFVVSRFEKLRGHVPLTPCRVAVLRSFTVEPIVPVARALAFTGGIDLEFRIGDFNTYAQEILDPTSWLYSYQPQVIILAAQTRDTSPELWANFADLSASEVNAQVAAASDSFVQLLTTLRSRTDAHIIVHGLQTPPALAVGILDRLGDANQAAAIAQINAAIRQLARELKNVYVLDYDALIARHGANHWEDTRKWLTVRLPIAADRLIYLAREWLRFLHPITGRVCKCLVTDLDNTLWGGVIGEDGLDGIKLGPDTSGYAFANLQRAILDLHRRGVILGIASKNNPAEASEAIEKHANMLLRPQHFAATRINWNDKAQSLREIAAELNIGLDSLALIDDNPVEREWVREQLPEVSVIELPADPMAYAAALRDSPLFERLALTDEDRSRGKMYAEQRARAQLQSSVTSLEDFYRSLQMEVTITTVQPDAIARVAQLTQKTNQFNLTTRRYSEQQITEIAADPACRVYAVRVKDRLGDNGVVGVVITRDHDGRCEIDNLLLSCRVIGRTIETAILAHVAGEARSRGNSLLAGWYLASQKNAPAKDFYSAHDFAIAAERPDGSYWERNLINSAPICPPWITLTTDSVEARP